MCGITGTMCFVGAGPGRPDGGDVRAMTRALAHRGPHGEGHWTGPGVALGHRRLAIVDLSDAGAQPMTRAGLTITYNGELYNYQTLRRQLTAGHQFTSTTDTEVVLAAWHRWGVDALTRFEGMYAFAILDHQLRRLHLVRDRFGIKPLYYHRGRGFLAFASEVQALLHCRRVPREPDLETWTRHLLCSSTLQVDREATLLRGVRALPAAACLTVHGDGGSRLHRYWSLPQARTGPTPMPGPAAAQELRALVCASVAGMRMGDVDVASLLSGGLDSAAITATAAATAPITALTLAHADPATGRVNPDDDDLRYSRILSATNPKAIRHEVRTPSLALQLEDLDAVCDLAALSDDPRHVAILSNYRAVADLGLRVVLNGQGADELMGGYVNLPSFTGHLLDVRHPDPVTITRLPGSRQAAALSPEVLRRRAQVHDDLLAFHHALPGPPLEAIHRLLVALQLARIVQFEDHLAMAAGVEARFPFLDHRIAEWCFTRPFTDHLHPCTGQGKHLLRAAMTGVLPAELLHRRKQVFPHPDPAGLHRTLAALATEHENALRADPLVTHLLDLPPPGHLPTLAPATLWLLLMIWRWHTALQNLPAPPAAPCPPGPGTVERTSVR
jgi:asparagine synthase (glutamine-hydrolysing)